MRRDLPGATVTPTRNKPHQVRKLAGAQPRELAAVIHPPKRQASVTLQAVPAQVGDLQSFPSHRLHGIPEDRLHTSDFNKHARSKSTRQI